MCTRYVIEGTMARDRLFVPLFETGRGPYVKQNKEMKLKMEERHEV